MRPQTRDDFAFIVRKVCRHFLAENHSRQVRNLQASGDGVMIRDCHVLHSDFSKTLVGLQRIRVAGRKVQTAQTPNPRHGCCGGSEYEGRLSTSQSSSLGTQTREPILIGHRLAAGKRGAYQSQSLPPNRCRASSLPDAGRRAGAALSKACAPTRHSNRGSAPCAIRLGRSRRGFARRSPAR